MNSSPQPIKLEIFPLKRNIILLRLEHIGDLFDTKDSQISNSVEVRIQELAAYLYGQVNAGE